MDEVGKNHGKNHGYCCRVVYLLNLAPVIT